MKLVNSGGFFGLELGDSSLFESKCFHRNKSKRKIGKETVEIINALLDVSVPRPSRDVSVPRPYFAIALKSIIPTLEGIKKA